MFKARKNVQRSKTGPRGIMSSANSTFRQNDIKRLLKAASAAGVKIKGVEVDRNGKMLLVVDNDGATGELPQAYTWDDAVK
jgi:hypothetical protein